MLVLCDSLLAKSVMLFSWAGWHKGIPWNKTRGCCCIPLYVEQYKQYSYCLLVGGRMNLDLAYRPWTSLIFPSKLYCVSVLICCPPLVLPGCCVWYQIAIDLLPPITLQPCGCKQQLGNLSCAPSKHASKTTTPLPSVQLQAGWCHRGLLLGGRGSWAAGVPELGTLPGDKERPCGVGRQGI